jgi:hypothetical protein
MIISVKETTVFSVFHPDAQDLFNTCSDLKKVAWELWDPSRRLNDEVRPSQYSLRTDLSTHYCILSFFLGRINKYNCSALSHPCFAKDPPRRSKTPSKRWVVASLSSRRNLMGSVCNCTSEAMNIFTVLGW